MNTLHKILVPIDFEAPSDCAIRFAADLARRLASSVTLMHVYDSRGYALKSGYVTYTREELRQLTMNRTQRLEAARQALEALGVMRVDTQLVDGLPAPTIVEAAHTGAFDLIVMATHGKMSPWQRLIGLIAEDVLSDAPCPVMMINDELAPAQDRALGELRRSQPSYAH